ncbi:MAG: glycosyltransferase family A protein [Planctomycetota bacterium]
MTPLQAVHELAPKLRSEFIALQDAAATSLPKRIESAINELRRHGADFIGSPLGTIFGDIDVPADPGSRFEPSIPWPTLVFRRATFLDLGGVSDRKEDADIELLYRAHACGAKIVSMPWATVQLDRPWEPAKCEAKPDYSMRFGSLRHHALGFPKVTVACDVVLPIYGQLDYVRPALESIMEQEDAEAIVHLVDDCGPEDVSELFRYWGSHPRVRLYRNQRNLGQYTSFNNVSDFFETELVAIQDGDDISLPHRLSVSGNLLELADGDYFAATMEQFGTADALPNRRSRFPQGAPSANYFAMNPTACFRVAMFRSLGGFADYGAHERNRCGLDTEFMNRAYHCERRFAVSTSVVTRHRIHAAAATQRSDTGFGSLLRNQADMEARRRIDLLRNSRMDPRYFGGLGNHRSLTQRLMPGAS